MIDQVNELYLTNNPKNNKSTTLLTMTTELVTPKLESKIVRQIDSVTRFFDQKVKDL